MAEWNGQNPTKGNNVLFIEGIPIRLQNLRQFHSRTYPMYEYYHLELSSYGSSLINFFLVPSLPNRHVVYSQNPSFGDGILASPGFNTREMMEKLTSRSIVSLFLLLASPLCFVAATLYLRGFKLAYGMLYVIFIFSWRCWLLSGD